MPRRNRLQRWALVMIAVAGTVVGTAAAAQPTEHRPPTTSIAPTTVAPPTEPPTTVPPTTVPDTTVPDTTVPPTTSPPPPPPSTTAPPIQEPTTTTTTVVPPPPPPSTTEPPIQEPTTTTTTVVPPPPSTSAPAENDDRATPAPSGRGGDDGAAGPGAGAPAASGGGTGAQTVTNDGRDEVALPSADWLFSDGRALVAPSTPQPEDTRPLWLAVLFGLAAGIGLTATASVVVSNLEHPED